jgi:thioesterase domain-containing protein
MHNLAQALQETLAHEIPITQHLAIRVVNYDQTGLVLQAPLAPNINHKQTAFAGSLNSVVTLAGWGLLWLILKELALPARVVIQDSECSYLRPVSDDFSAFCPRPEQEQIDRMAEALKKRGKARIELHTEILNGTTVAVSFTGRYVIMSINTSEESREGGTSW